MRRRLRLSVLALGGRVAAACERVPRDEAAWVAAPVDGAASSAIPYAETAVSTAPDSLRLELESPREARAGATIPMTLRVANATDRALDLTLRGREIVFDIVVVNANGAVVWRRLEDQMIPAILRLETVPSRGAIELRATWGQRTNRGDTVGPGEYRVHGEVLTDGESLQTPPVELRIVEP